MLGKTLVKDVIQRQAITSVKIQSPIQQGLIDWLILIVQLVKLIGNTLIVSCLNRSLTGLPRDVAPTGSLMTSAPT